MSPALVAPRSLDPQILTDRAREAVAHLRVTDARLSDMLEPYFQAHAAWPEGRSYRLPPAAVRGMQDDIALRWGPAGIAAFHKAALLEGLRRTREALPSHDRWPHSLPYFDDNVVRVLALLDGWTNEALAYPSDVFAKNMALATGRMWHAMATLVEPRLGIGSRRVYSASFTTALHALGLHWRLGGFDPLYEMHLYDHLLHWFTEEGWAHNYRMIAQALTKDPQARGVFGSTWFFDPELARVSPRLAYLYRFPVERGATFLKLRQSEDDIRLALTKSATRRRMFQEGTYRPQGYLMVWTRSSMLEWLASGAA